MKHLLLMVILISCSSLQKNYNKVQTKNADGTVKAVIEIPAGTNQKWEVKSNGKLEWDIKNGKKRYINYLPYPGNYGMISGTLSGDGDPFDVIILGPTQKRGSVVSIKVIGALRTIDRGEEDDKLIAILDASHLDTIEKEITRLHEVTSLKELGERYPGIKSILQTFFKNYKGKNKIKTLGFVELKDYKKWQSFIK